MNTMPKLEARVKPFADKSDRPVALLAFVELTIADAFVIKGIRVMKRRDEPADADPFITFPAEKGRGRSEDRWFDVAHPINPEARAAAIDSILLEYFKAVPSVG
jgi:DNA-binding cell septation regulator SpoVG